MKYQLILDTSSKYLVVAVADNEKVLKSIQYPAWQRQSEVAMTEINNIFESLNIKAKDIDTIIVSKGPGSYTGIRIALTIAKTLAMVLECKIITLSSLEMFVKPVGKYVSILDARSKRAYVGRYENGLPTYEDCVLTIDELKEWISNNPDYQVVGEVKVLGLEEVEVDLAKHMFEMSKNKESVKDVDALVPTYLKENYDY
jgi:tRNA threonylcarbamoyl adenosine modification protein YeaZ